MRNYEPSPENNISHKGALILYGMAHKVTGKPAWAIPGGAFTTNKKEAARVAAEIYKMRGKK